MECQVTITTCDKCLNRIITAADLPYVGRGVFYGPFRSLFTKSVVDKGVEYALDGIRGADLAGWEERDYGVICAECAAEEYAEQKADEEGGAMSGPTFELPFVTHAMAANDVAVAELTILYRQLDAATDPDRRGEILAAIDAARERAAEQVPALISDTSPGPHGAFTLPKE